MLKQFFLAVQGNLTSYHSFLKKWSAIDDTVRTNHNSLQKDALDTIQSTASVIDIAASGFLEIHQSLAKMEKDIQTDVSKILDEEMSHLSIDDNQTSRRSTVPSTPLYVKPAYTWLLSNLHNPYPSKEMKKTISRDTECSVKDIDAWFIDVRKRIGWNSLRRAHFGNKQERIIAAAARVYNPKASSYTDDLSTPLCSEVESNDNHRADFLKIQRSARTLYADKFPDLIPQLYDHTTDQVSSTVRPKIDHIKAGLDPLSTFSPIDETNTNNSYPTPEPSPCHIEEPQTSVPLQVPQHLQSNVRKRRVLSQEHDSDGKYSESNSSRPFKRIRYDDSPDANSLPEANELTSLKSAAETTKIALTNATIPTAQKRKRRLSDADCHPPSKRPHNALCMPRLQTVSDPLPMMKLQTSRFAESSPQENTPPEDWFSDSIPSPANTEDLNHSETSLSIDLHHYDFSPYNFGIHLPEFPTTHIENVEPGVPHHPIDTVTLSTVEPHSFTDLFQDAGLDCIDAFNMQFYLDSMPSYHPDLQCDQNKAANDFGVFVNSELLLSTSGCTDVPPSLVDGIYSITDNLDSTPTLPAKNSVLGSFNHAISKGLSNSEDQTAKRARAQALREELARYEAEGL